jgi:hypothetical protein
MDDLEKVSSMYDKVLLGILEEGREIVDTRTGEIKQVQATAADLNVIRQRLKDCGITTSPTASNPIGNILTEMRNRNLKLGDFDESDDAATA